MILGKRALHSKKILLTKTSLNSRENDRRCFSRHNECITKSVYRSKNMKAYMISIKTCKGRFLGNNNFGQIESNESDACFLLFSFLVLTPETSVCYSSISSIDSNSLLAISSFKDEQRSVQR